MSLASHGGFCGPCPACAAEAEQAYAGATFEERRLFGALNVSELPVAIRFWHWHQHHKVKQQLMALGLSPKFPEER